MTLQLAAPIGIAASYLVGSLPFGKWVASTQGVDILKEGSGNIGATNVWRVLGPKFGMLVFVLDMLKGFVPAAIFPLLLGFAWAEPVLGIMCGAAAVVGHSFSPFLRFRGGKSVATALGIMIAITPLVAAICFGIFCLFLIITRYVSVGSILGSASAPLLAAFFKFPTIVIVVYAILAALILFRHRANIKRLFTGSEAKFELKKKAEPEIQ